MSLIRVFPCSSAAIDSEDFFINLSRACRVETFATLACITKFRLHVEASLDTSFTQNYKRAGDDCKGENRPLSASARRCRPSAHKHSQDPPAKDSPHRDRPIVFGRETVDSASGPASAVLRWCGRRVRGLGPGLTFDSADADALSCETICRPGPGFLAPPALPV